MYSKVGSRMHTPSGITYNLEVHGVPTRVRDLEMPLTCQLVSPGLGHAGDLLRIRGGDLQRRQQRAQTGVTHVPERERPYVRTYI